MKYAEILDNTWWEDNSPYTYINENEEEVYYKWNEYLTMGNKLWKTITDTKEFAIFSRNGKPVDIGNYTSDKITFVTERYYESYRDNKPYYLLYDHLRSNDYYTKPIDVDFKRNLMAPLHPIVINNITTYYSDENHTIKVLEEHDYTTYTEIYWYNNFGRDDEPKIYKRPQSI